MNPSSWEHLRPWALRSSALVVAGVAAYSSYEHQRHFAVNWGADPVGATLWPFSVDGLLVLASLRLLEVDSSTRWRIRASVWAAFLLGVAVSLVANIAAAPVLTWQSVVVAGWPPIALLLAVELLSVARDHVTTSAVQPQASASVQNSETTHLSAGSPAPSVRERVRNALEKTRVAMSNSEIVTALRASQNGTPDPRLSRNVANALWSLRKAGLVETQNGKSTLAPVTTTTASKPLEKL